MWVRSHGFPLRFLGSPTQTQQGFKIQLPMAGSYLIETGRACFQSLFPQSPLRVAYPRSKTEDQSCKSIPIWLSLFSWIMAGVLFRVGLFYLEPNYEMMAYVLQQWVWPLFRMQGFQLNGKTLSWTDCSFGSKHLPQPSDQLTAMELCRWLDMVKINKRQLQSPQRDI